MTKTISVVVNPLPVVSNVSASTLCSSGVASIQLTSSGGGSYGWKGPNGYSSTLQNPVLANATSLNSGSYTVVVTNASGCSAVQVVAVNVGTCGVGCTLNASVVSSVSAVCAGGSVTLTATPSGNVGSVTYQWSGPNLSGTSGSSVTAGSLSTTSTFTVVVSEGSCSVTKTISVVVNPLPVVSNVSASTLCSSGVASIQLTSSGGGSYGWKGPNGYSSTLQNPVISNATSLNSGSYTVVVTNASGCSAVQVVAVNVGTCGVGCTLNASVVSSVSAVCAGGSVTLTATPSGNTGAVSYQWSGPNLSGTSGSSVTAGSLSTTSTFTVVVSEGSCSVTKTISVVVNPLPVVSNVSASTLCSSGVASIQLTSSGGGSYGWKGPNGYSSTLQNPVLANATSLNSGSYTVVVTNASGCSTAQTTSVNVGVCGVGCNLNASVVSSVSAVCAGGSVTLTATPSGNVGSVTYQWSGPNLSGTSGSSVTAGSLSTTSTFTVVVSEGGCSVTKTISVVVNPLPVVVVETTTNPTTCSDSKDGSIVLGSLIPDQSYEISYRRNNGEVINQTTNVEANGQITLTALSSGSYSITVTSGSCSGNPVTATLTAPGGPEKPQLSVSPSATSCIGETITLTAKGAVGATFHWTGAGLSEQTGSVVTVKPTAVASQFYSVTQTVNGCTSSESASVMITGVQCTTCSAEPPILSCTITDICPGDAVELTASDCAGIIVWSTNATGQSIVVTPVVSTTYTAQCKLANCISAPSKPIVIKVSDPKPPTIIANSADVCIGGTVSLTATGCEGKIIWSTGATGSILTVTPQGSTTYYANCRIHNCISGPSQGITIRTGPIPTPQVSSTNNTICPGGNSTLTVSTCSGQPLWSTGETTASIVVSPSETTSYTVVCKQGACLSPVSNPYTITVVKPQPPQVDSNADVVCLGGSVQLTAMGCSGTVIWTHGATGSSVTVSPTANTTYRATCVVNSCTSDPSQPLSVTVVNPAAPIVKSTKTLICAGEPVTLTAEGCGSGQVVWSTGATGNSLTVMPGSTTDYTAQCREYNCTSVASNKITVNVTNSNAPTPTVVASATSICKDQPVTLTATGCGAGIVVWSTGATGSSLVVNPTQTTEYHAACKMNEQCHGNPAKVTVQVNTPPTPSIRVCKCTDGHICLGDEIRLTVAGCSGIPQWSNGANSTSILVSPAETTVYTVTCQNNLCTSAPSEAYTVVVSTPTPPVVWASKTEIEPGETVTLSATGCTGGQIIWSTGATGSSIEVSPTTTTSYYAHCKIKGCLSDPTPVIVRIKGECNVPVPVVSASTSVVCSGGSATLQATGCTGGTVVWSNGATGSRIVITNITGNRPYTATCIVSDVCASRASAPISVSVITLNPPTVAADKQVLCPGETAQLTAVGCPGMITWSTGETGTNISIKPVVTTDYWATCSLGDCISEKSPLSTVKIGSPVSPTITASMTTVCFGSPVTLTAAGCDGYVIWSNNQVGPEIIITPALSATYSAVCCTSSACKSGKSNDVVVKVYPKVKKPLVVNITNECPFATADLTKALSSSVALTGSVFEFYTSSVPNSAQKVANPKSVEAGTYYVVEKTATGCYSLSSQIMVVIINCNDVILCTTNPATVSAGPDATICAAKDYKLNGSIGGAATSAVWTSSGTGTFDNASLLDATYKPSLADVQAGFVHLTFTTNDPDGNGPCKAAQASLKLTIEGIKIQPTIGQVNPVLCHGDSVVLSALPDGYKYLWNTKATAQRILVKTTGLYSVQLVDEKGCTSIASEALAVTVKNPIESPIAPMMARNACPAHTVDLTKLIENDPFTPGGVFEFHIEDNPASPIVMRPDSVGHGMFFAFERSGSGCYSPSTMIDVAIFDCDKDTCQSDLYVTYSVDKKNPKVGDTITFSVKLGNKGECTATHSDIRIILPSGLELVSPGNLIVDAHGHLGAWITTLAKNEEISYYYTARVLTKGPIVNLVEITYLDQTDPILSNNKATVTIEDSTVTQSMMVGVAKALKGVRHKEESLFEFTYDIALTNYSDQDATDVQVSDDVQSVFDPHVIESVSTSVGKASTLKLNPGYSGWVGNIQLLTAGSVLKAGMTEHILLKVNVRLHPDGSLTKTFNNQAYLLATLNGLAINDASTNGSKPDPDNDGNPNNNSEPTPAKFDSAPPSEIGVALAVAKIEEKADSSYNVTLQVTVKNYGKTDLKQVQLSDSLVAGLVAPVAYSVVSAPVVGTNSTLKPNPNYNGSDLSSLLDGANSSLAVGASDTVLVTINVKPNSQPGPFYTQVIGTGIHNDTLVTDLSNNGFNPAPLGSIPTGFRFDLPPSLLGVAKSISKLEDLGLGVYNVTYTIKVSNLGSDDLKQVQVMDNLTDTFGNDVLIGPNKPVLTADAGLTVDTTYTGQGMLTNLLIDSLSTLPKYTSRNINLTVRVDVRNSSKTVFQNSAIGTAMTLDGSTMLTDTSTAGSNVDPDNDLDPRNNSTPTGVTLLGLPVKPNIGVAMAVKDTARQADGSYNVTYQVIVKNYGLTDFSNVQLTDKLAEVFNATTGASFSLNGTPVISAGSQLQISPTYNGDTDPELLAAGSRLAAGKSDTLVLTLNVKTDGRTTPYLSTLYAKATAGSDTVSDVSTDGFEPDLNGNNDPTESDESVATPLSFNRNADDVIIPEGFSPNGDNINDLFIIRNTGGATVMLEVFNRWGNTVYRNHDYRNDWDGTTNTGVRIGSSSKGLPDGTYFYIVELSDGRKFIRYMTINR
ncbi:T9SS type B sorting domain-containing protein [Larkinella rosea]|uniref:DUF11 domain-containing protein n=1 Tax=Larkinella rosea TaxID=2025312 RepID=A0A3P1C014_9BACT|nr:gliding motility-associated C-terminal domain-containing protein [Larkinella rosea]RRB06383.1 hypothetical protein EHT25_00845 [Larkinella rosea]